MKEFCIAGPVKPERHYYLPERVQLNVHAQNRSCFNVYAPRQSGKTTIVREYAAYLNALGTHSACYVSLETAHNAPTLAAAISAFLGSFLRSIRLQLPEEKKVQEYLEDVLADGAFSSTIPVHSVIVNFLTYWAQISPKPLVLFFDEVDGLSRDSLISFFKQIRAGFEERSQGFPHSIGLIGVRSFKVHEIEDLIGGPFISAYEAIRLPDFTRGEIEKLYQQHTDSTGQVFTPEALEHVFHLTRGQPWLVNALAFEACFRNVTDRSIPITGEVIDKARKVLILRRDTHLDSLLDRLTDKRVIGIIDAIMCGKESALFNDDDVQYVRDLGLVKRDEFKIANPIYQEIIPRALTSVLQTMISDKIAWYCDKNGNLDMNKVLERFTHWYRENSQTWFTHYESGPHMLLMAFLDRLVNGGGDVQREFALGSRRADIVVFWKQQRILIEVKIYHGADTITQGLLQTVECMDYCANSEGHLVVFDRDPQKSWEEKVSYHVEQVGSRSIGVWQM